MVVLGWLLSVLDSCRGYRMVVESIDSCEGYWMVLEGIRWLYRVIYAWLWRVLDGRDGYLMNPALGVGEPRS